jgi:two-component system, cell cycle sensor histidine kinase and response regulator CckA
VGKGTGLGLAEVYGTVRAHHGAVVVESRAGEGTAVTVWLPACGDEASAGPDRDGSAPPAAAEPLRVLVADDEANVRRTLALLLRGEGHAVVECAGGREAVERYARDWRELDVVILDLMMPDLGGADVLARLRAANPRARVIVSSGYGPATREAAALGDVHWLHKPYTAAELARVLATAAGEARERRSAS